MDEDIPTFDWNRARAFLATAEGGSFSAAGRRLGVAQPTVGRQVAALEQELGVTLFERVGRGLQLTEAGLDLVEHVRAMEEAASRLRLTADGRSTTLEGIVRITASEAISAYLLPPIVGRIREEHPGIEVELVVSNEVRDLRRREADIAVRSGQPKDPELVGRRVKISPAHLYATPAYLERVGSPDTPDALAAADVTIFGFGRAEQMVESFTAFGLHLTREHFPIVTSNHLVQWAMCRAGLGLCAMMEEVGDPDPDVVRAVPEMPPLQLPMWLVAHRGLRTSRRVRVVFDLLAEGLAAP